MAKRKFKDVMNPIAGLKRIVPNIIAGVIVLPIVLLGTYLLRTLDILPGAVILFAIAFIIYIWLWGFIANRLWGWK